MCLNKRYNDFVSGHDVWLWPCKDNAKTDGIFKKQGRMQWQWMKEVNEDGEKTYTNMIMSTGSKLKNKNKPFCLTFYKIDSIRNSESRLILVTWKISDRSGAFS